MIKFFRQIRQRLLHKNAFSKYLPYAIGEILPVLASNDTLRLLISSWPEKLDVYRYQAGLNYDLYNFRISSFLSTKYLYRNTEVDAGKGSTGRSSFPFAPMKLLSDPELENLVELKRVDSEAMELAALKLLKTQNRILNLITAEFNNSQQIFSTAIYLPIKS